MLDRISFLSYYKLSPTNQLSELSIVGAKARIATGSSYHISIIVCSTKDAHRFVLFLFLILVISPVTGGLMD